MPYAERNSSGEIVSLHAEEVAAVSGSGEFIDSMHPEVLAFLARTGADGNADNFPLAADLKMIRVIEDIVDLMVDKNLIMFTDLPEAVREKLIAHKSLRDRMTGGVSILGDEGGIL